MKEIEQYIKKIVDHTDCTKEEKEDLAEELTVHLEILTEENIKKGMSETDAVQEAIRAFGAENVIGEGLQQALFPYRRELLVTLSLAFITISFASFSIFLFDLQEALNIELIINVCIGLGLLFVTVSQTFNTKRKLAINSLLILTIVGSALNGLMLAYTDTTFSLFLTFCNYTLIIALIIMLYKTTLHNGVNNQPFTTMRKKVHIVNITFGLLLLAATLFFLYGFLIFGGWMNGLLLLFIPLAVWICLYIFQIRFHEHKTIIYPIFTIYGLLVGSVVFFFIYEIF